MKNEKKITVMHFLPRWTNGGMERAVIDICTHGDFSRFKYSIVVGNLEENYRVDELEKKGIAFKALKEYEKYSFKDVLKSYYRFLRKNREFDVIHIHINNSIGLIFSWIAKNYSKSRVIVHTHNNAFSTGNMFVKKVLRFVSMLVFLKFPDAFFACSESAGEWTFGNRIKNNKHYHVVYNGVDHSKYEFDSDLRIQMRKKFAMENDFIIGHVGHFNYQKNQTFLVELFSAIVADGETSYRLVLVGSGANREIIMNQVVEKGLDDYITIVDPTEHIEEYYSMFDALVLPSKFEGFGLVVVEAQYNGLPVICSDRVPFSTDISSQVDFLPIDKPDSIKEWKERIYLLKSQRNGHYQLRPNIKFDISSIVKIIEKEYSYPE